MSDLATIVSDPEQRQRAREIQDERREKLGHRVAQTPAHVNFRFGKARETAVRAQMTTDTPFDSYLYQQLAEAYALQGRFNDAAETSVEGPQREEYEQKALAVQARGLKRCACPLTIRVPDGKNAMGREEQTLLPIEEVFDGKLHLIISRCALCDVLSVQVGSIVPAMLERHASNVEKS